MFAVAGLPFPLSVLPEERRGACRTEDKRHCAPYDRLSVLRRTAACSRAWTTPLKIAAVRKLLPDLAQTPSILTRGGVSTQARSSADDGGEAPVQQSPWFVGYQDAARRAHGAAPTKDLARVEGQVARVLRARQGSLQARPRWRRPDLSSACARLRRSLHAVLYWLVVALQREGR